MSDHSAFRSEKYVEANQNFATDIFYTINSTFVDYKFVKKQQIPKWLAVQLKGEFKTLSKLTLNIRVKFC